MRRPAHAQLDPFVVVQGRAAWVPGPANMPVHGRRRRRDCGCHHLHNPVPASQGAHPDPDRILCPICAEAQGWGAP